jgi:carbon storage regulator
MTARIPSRSICVFDDDREGFMLVLARKIGESILIGESVKVVVLAASNSQVRLGIDAPRSISIYRTEVYQRMHPEGEVALSAAVVAGNKGVELVVANDWVVE